MSRPSDRLERVQLSSGVRLLLILTAWLTPLGILALVASVQSARSKHAQHEADARLVATAQAQQIDLLVIRGADIVRFAAGAVGDDPRRCRTLAAETGKLLRFDAQIALFAPGGRMRCRSGGFEPGTVAPARDQIGIDVRLGPDGGLIFTVNALDGSYGVGRLPPDLLRKAIGGGHPQGVVITQGERRFVLATGVQARALDQQITVAAPIASGQLSLVTTSVTNAITSFEIMLVLLPILMWASAAIIGWIVMNQLVLRPLRDLEQAVALFGAGGEASFVPPKLTSPALEIEALGGAFAASAERIASREAALEQGLQHQIRLVREVHHRVKNNLQVVASLINLHARGASGEVADAYASIQRRVDALAVVHRNHYAELEENHGVALRALLAELTSNLRATAPAAAASLRITLDMPAAHVSQDAAVPVAFLVTEIVELLMISAPTTSIAISLEEERADRGLLVIASPALREDAVREHPAFPRFDRIVSGLSRQLRSALNFDVETSAYSISIALLP